MSAGDWAMLLTAMGSLFNSAAYMRLSRRPRRLERRADLLAAAALSDDSR